MEILNQAMGLIKTFAILGGGVWVVVGVILFGTALRNKTGPEMQSAIWQIVGGGMIIAAGVFFDQLTAGISLPTSTSLNNAIEYAQLFFITRI